MNRKGNDEKKKKHKKKGHHQKGSGTIVSSKGEFVRHGVTIKEWQRTPVQLLHEYCQSKKRLRPQYYRVKAPEGKFRFRCTLPDEKNQSKDLNFCPEQSSESMDASKHHAALLALFYLDPTRPHERKLPDPYRDLWLQLPNQNEKNPSQDSNSIEKSTQKQKKSKEISQEEKNEIDLWGNAIQQEEIEDVKKQSTTISSLTMDRPFASKAEYQQSQLKKQEQRNQKKKSRENRQRANPNAQVLMSAKCREALETIISQYNPSILELNHTGTTKESIRQQINPKDIEVLVNMGFLEEHTILALNYVRNNSKSYSNQEIFLSHALDWLCLNVPEDQLPRAFNPKGTQLDVILASSSKEENVSDLSHEALVLIKHLMKFGYTRHDILQASQFLSSQTSNGNEWIEWELKQQLHKQLIQFTHRQYPSLPLNLSSQEKMDPSTLEDEILALEAIYDEAFHHSMKKNGDIELEIQLESIYTENSQIQVTFYLPKGFNYPYSIPMFFIQHSKASPETYLPSLIFLTKEALIKRGEPMIYELCTWIQTSFDEKLRPNHEIYLFEKSMKTISTSKSKSESESKSTQTLQKSPKNEKILSQSTSSLKSENIIKKNPMISQKFLQELNQTLLNEYQKKCTNLKYQQMIQCRKQLPAAKEKRKLLDLIQTTQVILISGETGCGKTTQIPQYLLENAIENGFGGQINMICTQPRRLAAIGVATRVADERIENIGDVIGYQIRLENRLSKRTRLTFCTTGILLRRLIQDPLLEGITHILVDEIHERNVDTDFLLSILRDLLSRRPSLRLILMSATMNEELFQNYFSENGKRSCPILRIPGRTFPVTVHYLKEILALTQYKFPSFMYRNTWKQNNKEAWKFLQQYQPLQDQSMDSTTSMDPLVCMMQGIDEEKTDYQLIGELVSFIVLDENHQYGHNTGAILIFMSGTIEIKTMCQTLERSACSDRLWILPLHGGLSSKEQSKVFQSPPQSHQRKVVVSTNIAETSLTIDDVVVVIDRGRVKESQYDAQNQMSMLVDTWCSKAACNQRKGRAGRVQKGHCFRLFSRRIEEKTMRSQQIPEMHRVSLEQLCLQVKKMQLGSIERFLRKAIEPPQSDAIKCAINMLREIGALNKETENLTALGHHLGTLPLDARLGKMLLFGCMFRCIDSILTIASVMSNRSPFLSTIESRDMVEQIKNRLAYGSSDHLIYIRLFQQYQGTKNRRQFCKENYLSFQQMETIGLFRQQLIDHLKNIQFLPKTYSSQWEFFVSTNQNTKSCGNSIMIQYNQYANDERIVKACLCAGFYGHIIHVVYPEQKYQETVQGAISQKHEAKQLKYYIRMSTDESPKNSPTKDSYMKQRVHLHPSSVNFKQGSYTSCYLLYSELVQTSKLFIRESTMINPYAMLLFGGELEILHEKGIVIMDQWLYFNAVGRIAVLIKAIRQLLDELLQAKIQDPKLDISDSALIETICQLILTDGM